MAKYKQTLTKAPEKPSPKTKISSSPAPARLNFTASELHRELTLVNDSGDRVFVPGTLKVSASSPKMLNMTWKSYANGDCRMQISLKDQSFLAYKEYDEEEDEIITEARPSLQRKFADFDRSKEYGTSPAEITASNLADAMADLDSPDKNWNTDTHALSFLYFGEAHGDVNSALRNKTYFNPEAIATLDSIMSKDTLKRGVTVYRGIRDPKGTVKEKILSGTYRDAGYLSTTTAEQTARNFSGGGRKGSILMKLTLPAGTKCADLRKDSEAEIALPRDFDLSKAEWTFF